jgi:hypothetical protein
MDAVPHRSAAVRGASAAAARRAPAFTSDVSTSDKVVVAAAETPVEPAPAPQEGGAQDADSSDETLYLTIIGDKTYFSRGRAGEGPPSINELRSASIAGSGGAVLPASSRSVDSPRASLLAQAPRASNPTPQAGNANSPRVRAAATDNQAAAAPSQPAAASDRAGLPADIDRPWTDDRPWPNSGCPWTLPEGTSQPEANSLSAQYGCRYLASCSFATQQCTFYYQGSS